MTGIIGLVVILTIYFAPALNAYLGKKKKSSAILALNLFLGWTMLGWVIALIWSFADDQK